jgi:peptide/nickel transport system substrate-binding protein
MIVYVRIRLQRVLRRYRRLSLQNWRRFIRFLQFGVFGKWRQFTMVRRFALVWWVVILLAVVGLLWQIRALRDANILLQKLPGGSYTEGVVGTVKNLNPVLPEGGASADAVRLIFSGLTQFDTNGQLQPDLATSWQVSPDGKTYTFTLRHGVRWQDGAPFTAQDVVFTIDTIQNPATRSPLEPAWQNVKATAPNNYTVVFSLPKPDVPFIDATTVGILPKHLLGGVAPGTLAVAGFNQNPVGTGPFKLTDFDQTDGLLGFAANDDYYAGKPLLQTMTLRLYTSPEAALTAYTRRQVQGVAGLDPGQVSAAHALGTLNVYTATQPDAVAVFLQTTSPILKDKTVRLALAEATNRQDIIKTQLDGQATALASPLVPSTPAVTGAAHQPAYNRLEAEQTLDSDGWQLQPDGVRSKSGQRLELQLVTQSGSVYDGVAQELAKQWAAIGVKLDITQASPTSLEENYIPTRNYDALLYGINTGADPDVYAYWDSSQIKSPGLNLSDYNSPAADSALQAGRTLQDPSLRVDKYRSFVQTWVADTPAVMLYTPLYEYGVDSGVYGVQIHKLINPADRFSDVQDWAVKVSKSVIVPH